MAPLACNAFLAPDHLTAALCAAELGEPYDLGHAPSDLMRELFAAVPQLRVSVPYAALRLLARLAFDNRVEVRAAVARALPWFLDRYPELVEQLLLPLACDASRKVRAAAADALAAMLQVSFEPEQLIERWGSHPDRARAVLVNARRLLPPPLGL